MIIALESGLDCGAPEPDTDTGSETESSVETEIDSGAEADAGTETATDASDEQQEPEIETALAAGEAPSLVTGTGPVSWSIFLLMWCYFRQRYSSRYRAQHRGY